MTTPEELTTALNDFITECSHNHYICKKCKYNSVCEDFSFANKDPNDWEYFGEKHFGLTEKEWAELF